MKSKVIKITPKQAEANAEKFYRVHEAMEHIAEAFCECALANHLGSGSFSAKTSDGMEWHLKFEKFGKRNPRTGKIDKRFK